MADEELKKKIKKVLTSGYFQHPDDGVFVTDGCDDFIHVVVVSKKFEGQRLRAKTDLILSELMQNLEPEEWGKVTLAVARTPEELTALTP